MAETTEVQGTDKKPAAPKKAPAAKAAPKKAGEAEVVAAQLDAVAAVCGFA